MAQSIVGRDDFREAIKQTLAKRVGMRCSNPQCRKTTWGPSSEPDKALNIGVAAHICAAAPAGPRYDDEMTSEQRISIENGIWLCQNCAHLIDHDLYAFTRDSLVEWKLWSEAAARNEIRGQRFLRARKSVLQGVFNSGPTPASIAGPIPTDWNGVGLASLRLGLYETQKESPNWAFANERLLEALKAYDSSDLRDWVGIGKCMYMLGFVEQSKPDYASQSADSWYEASISAFMDADPVDWASAGVSWQQRGFLAESQPIPDWLAAEEMYTEALCAYQQADPVDWTAIGTCYKQLGFVAANGSAPNWIVVADWLQRALDACLAAEGPDMTIVSRCYHQCCCAAYALGKVAKAIEWIEQAIAAEQQAQNPDVSTLNAWRADLSMLKSHLGPLDRTRHIRIMLG